MIVIKEKVSLLPAMFFLGIPLMNVEAAESLHDTQLSIRQEITVESCMLDNGKPDYSYDLGSFEIGEMIQLLANKKATARTINENIGISCPGATSAKYSLSAKESDACTVANGSDIYLCSNPNNRTVGIYIATNVNNGAEQIHGTGNYNHKVTSVPLNGEGKGSFTISKALIAPNSALEPRPGPISANYILSVWGS
ncbi:hypothetical protein [Aeromonas jandaei]|uniref:hypothetical protein n=1 Tax=Aeromonas jandaei TaxID=650 RepID=UPI002B0605D3|nr:hypothetical protein [Aeromonas jandaei]